MRGNSATTKIVNVVASAALRHEVDLNAVVKAFPSVDVEYRPGQFPGLVFRLKKPRTATLIFHSGKMVCTGAKSVRDAIRALKSVVRRLKKAGVIILGKPEIKVQNIVASGSFGGTVDLVELYVSERDRGGGIMYEPEQFPGLIYRMENPHAVILIFASGKLVCTGAKKEEDVHEAINKLRRKLEYVKVIHYEKSATPLITTQQTTVKAFPVTSTTVKTEAKRALIKRLERENSKEVCNCLREKKQRQSCWVWINCSQWSM